MLYKHLKLDNDIRQHLEYYFSIELLSTCSFYQGLPWFIWKKFANAVALPSVLFTRRFNIFMIQFNTQSEKNIKTLFHEIFHVFQYHILGYRGWGFINPSFIIYVSLFFKHRYFNHPMEISARNFENFISVSNSNREQEKVITFLHEEKNQLHLLKKQVFNIRNFFLVPAVISCILLQLLVMLVNVIIMPITVTYIIINNNKFSKP